MPESSKEKISFIFPLEGDYEITGKYGLRKHPVDQTIRGQTFHNGVDIKTAEGAPILSGSVEVLKNGKNPFTEQIQCLFL